MVERISKLLIFIGSLLAILGFVDIYTFYSNFNIPIVKYIPKSELIFSFSDLNIYSIFIVIIVILTLLISEPIIKHLKLNDYVRHSIFHGHKTPFYLRVPEWVYRTIATITIMIIAICFYLLELRSENYSSFNIFLFILFSWISSYNFIKLIVHLFNKSTKDIDGIESSKLPYISILVSVLISILLSNNLKYTKAINGVTEFNIKFSKNSKTIESSKGFIFVGQTKEYIFMKNLTNAEVDVIQKSEITNIKIISNEEVR